MNELNESSPKIRLYRALNVLCCTFNYNLMSCAKWKSLMLFKFYIRKAEKRY